MAVSEMVTQRPCARMRGAVTAYHGYREAGTEPALHRGLPSGALTFIVTIDDPCHVMQQPDPAESSGRYTAFVAGLHTSPALIAHEGHQHGIQIDLSPLAARSVLGMPASALTPATVELGDLLGPFGHELCDRVASAPGWSERFAVLDEQLSSRLAQADEGHRAQHARGHDGAVGVAPELVRCWDRLERSDGAVTINELADDVGWSRRHLSQRFRAEFGLSPKVVARTFRFDRARRLLATGGHTIAEVAAAAGYADQAHLTREFNEFAGCSPVVWLAAEHPTASDSASGLVSS